MTNSLQGQLPVLAGGRAGQASKQVGRAPEQATASAVEDRGFPFSHPMLTRHAFCPPTHLLTRLPSSPSNHPWQIVPMASWLWWQLVLWWLAGCELAEVIWWLSAGGSELVQRVDPRLIGNTVDQEDVSLIPWNIKTGRRYSTIRLDFVFIAQKT